MGLFGRQNRLAAHTNARKSSERKAERPIVTKANNLAGHFFSSAIGNGKSAPNAHGVKRPCDLNHQPLNADHAPVVLDFGERAYFRQQCLH
jgi:hypothetical protein